MKAIQFFKTVIPAVALSSLFIFSSCDKDDDDDDIKTYTISGDANGSQEVPAVSTGAIGTLTGNYDVSTNVLNYNITWSGLSGNVNAAHIHGPAMMGENAGVIHPLNVTTNGLSGVISGAVTLSDSTETQLLAGNLYYNLHTAMHPNGEIRGQISTSRN